MSAISTELPPRYLRTKEAAQFLSLSARTLEKHRTYGTGPAYHKLGGRVVYAIEDLQAWVGRGAVCAATPLVKQRDIAGGDFGGSGSRA